MESRPRKLLLVEDDKDDYILTRSLLRNARGGPFELLWVETYDAALIAMENEELDAILVDYLLGPRNGLDLVREVEWER